MYYCNLLKKKPLFFYNKVLFCINKYFFCVFIFQTCIYVWISTIKKFQYDLKKKKILFGEGSSGARRKMLKFKMAAILPDDNNML